MRRTAQVLGQPPDGQGVHAVGHARVDANSAFRGRIPFGYVTVGPKYSKQLVPTARRRELVPVAYQMIINGASLAVVAEWLTERTGPAQCEKCEGTGKVDGKKCRDCIAWWPKVVAEMVRRPVCTGASTRTAPGLSSTSVKRWWMR